MKVLVYYHNDMDGRCCAAIVRKALLKEDVDFTFIPCGYNKGIKLPKSIDEYWRVYIVDFTLDEEVMEELEGLFNPNDVIWIDHHITSIDYYGERFNKFEGIRQDGIAACLLTWSFFYGVATAPKAVQYIADRDLWYFKLEGTKRFHEYMKYKSHSPSDVAWEYYLSDRAKLRNEIDQGEIMQLSRMKSMKRDVEYLGYKSELDGYKCLKVNYSSFETVSDMGHYICEELGYDVAWIYYKKMGDNGKLIQVNNLRSKEVDVSEIAKARGGGGHKLAAGFVIKLD